MAMTPAIAIKTKILYSREDYCDQTAAFSYSVDDPGYFDCRMIILLSKGNAILQYNSLLSKTSSNNLSKGHKHTTCGAMGNRNVVIKEGAQ